MAAPLYPLTFTPIFQERLWGSRRLEALYGKRLPANLPIGESWEISDRTEAMSIVDRGPLAGRTLHSLVEECPRELLGSAGLSHGRFPLLVKILDAADKLSLQVHPPVTAAQELQGEPKTELWYVTEAQPGAELFVGLRHGIRRQDFEERLQKGTVADCFHRVPVSSGSAMFVPSGRVHAIGAGCVIFEIQQNSDTTYRVFDWNRTGADGKPRALHVAQSLKSIDFDDTEPELVQSRFSGPPEHRTRPLVTCPFFEAELSQVRGDATIKTDARATIVAVTRGELSVRSEGHALRLGGGHFSLLPACLREVGLNAGEGAEFLLVRPM